MDLLSAIAIQVFRHAEEDEDIDSHEILPSTESDEEDGLFGDRLNRVRTRFGEGSIRARSGARHGRKDRTAWGSYTENCPPILPPNASITGFEDEALLIAERLRKRAERKSKKHEAFVTDDEESTDDEDVDEEEKQWDGGERTGHASDGSPDGGDGRRTVQARRARDNKHRIPLSVARPLRFPTPFSSFPSALFGSTTRPAARILTAPESSSKHTRDVASIRRRNMAAAKTHWWISLWFLLSAPVIFWDAAYCFMRYVYSLLSSKVSIHLSLHSPRSFAGGDLHWIWKPYEIYQEVDYIYGVEAYNRGDGFTNAQCRCY